MENHAADAVASASMDRRRLLKVGAAGAAATGALVAGGPRVLGLGTAPAYAAGTSTPGNSTTTLGATTGNLMVTLNLMDGLTLPATIPFAVPSQNVFMYVNADRNEPPAATTTASAAANTSTFSYTYANVAPGQYFADIQEPFQTFINAKLVELGMSTTYQVIWNYSNPVDEPWYPVIAPYQPVTITAGSTANLELDIQVRLITLTP